VIYAGAEIVKFMMVELCGIEEKKADKFLELSKNHLIYIKKKPFEYKEIQQEYEKLKSYNYDDRNALKIVAKRFEKSVKSVKRAINKYIQGSLFE